MRLRVEIPIVVLNPETSAPVSNAQVSIIDRETGGAGDVWTTETGGSLRAQPIITDSSGRVSGWIQRGAYEVEVTIPGRPSYTDYYEATPAKSASVDSEWIASEAITSNKIASGAVVTSKLSNDAVDTAQIKDGSITDTKLKNSASVDSDRPVSTNNIKNNAITSAKIAPGAISASNLATNVVPLGTVIDWWRATTSTSVPAGWAVCDGTAWSQIANDFSLVSGNIPNLIGKVIVGARLTTTAGGATAADGTGSTNGDAYANAPGIGGTGGSNSLIPGHGHAYNLGVAGDGGHGHSTGTESADHSHSGNTGGHSNDHTHAYLVGQDYRVSLRYGDGNQVTTDWQVGKTGYGTGGASANHTHAFSTGGRSAAHTHAVYGAGSHTHTITGTVGSNTNGDAAIDVRPAHVGLLKIMKVRII